MSKMADKENIFNLTQNGDVAEIELKGFIGIDEKEFTANTKELMSKEVSQLKDMKVNSILLKIGSLGGSVGQSEHMRDDLKDSGKIINILYTKNSASAALAFGAIAKEVSIYENGMLLIHEARGDVESATADKMESTARLVRIINENIIKGYVAQSARAGKNKTTEDFREVMRRNDNRGEWIGSSELLKLGLVTNVLPAFDAVNLVEDKEIFNKFGIPEFPINKSSLTKKKKTMSFFNFGKKDKLLSAVAGDITVTFVNIEKDAEVKILNATDDNEFTGVFEHDNKTVNVKDGKIENVVEKSEKDLKIEDLTNQVGDLTSLVNDLLTATKEGFEGVEKVTNKNSEDLKSAKLQVSNPKIPKQNISGENQQIEQSASEKIFNLQKERDEKAANRKAEVKTKTNNF